MSKSMPVARERDVSRAMVRHLRAVGYDVHRRNTGAMEGVHRGRVRRVRFSEPGASDYWLVLKNGGRHVEVEVKRPGRTPDIHQILWMLRMNTAGGAAFWVDNVDTLDYVLRNLEIGYSIYMDSDGNYNLSKDRDECVSHAVKMLVRVAGVLAGRGDGTLASVGRAALRGVGL